MNRDTNAIYVTNDQLLVFRKVSGPEKTKFSSRGRAVLREAHCKNWTAHRPVRVKLFRRWTLSGSGSIDIVTVGFAQSRSRTATKFYPFRMKSCGLSRAMLFAQIGHFSSGFKKLTFSSAGICSKIGSSDGTHSPLSHPDYRSLRSLPRLTVAL